MCGLPLNLLAAILLRYSQLSSHPPVFRTLTVLHKIFKKKSTIEFFLLERLMQFYRNIYINIHFEEEMNISIFCKTFQKRVFLEILSGI